MSVLQAERRTAGKPAQLRRKGLLPMALVCRDRTTALIQANEVDLKRAIAGADGLGRLDLEISGEKKARKVIVKQIDKDFVHQQILCVTLVEVSADDIVKIDIPVVGINMRDDFEGQGLSLTHPTDHLKVRGKMSAMPERLEVDLSTLEVGHHINAGDIQLPEGIELLSSPDSTVYSLQHLRAASLESDAVEAVVVEEGAEGGEAGEAAAEGESE